MSVSPPRPHGPPLNALRAFEAAARLGGFAQAADELSVTPGAISQHIKTLEDWTGTALFQRRAHGVTLSEAGATLLPHFTLAFDQLGIAIRALRAITPQPTLHIASLPSVAQLWLSPRLPALRKALPHIKLSVTAVETAPNLQREVFDLSLFIRAPSGSGAEMILAEDRIYPVCAPQIAAMITSEADLASQVLLLDDRWANDWQLWADGSGHLPVDTSRASRFSLYSLALDEAKNGAGILIGHDCLVADALAAGTLVRPFAESVPTGKALVLDVADGQTLPKDITTVVALLRG